MTVYVDHMGHMVADTEEELHAFAERIGLRRSWFQDKPSGAHYDLMGHKHALAVEYGAQEISWREMPEKAKVMVRLEAAHD